MTSSKAAIVARILTIIVVIMTTTLIVTESNLGASPAKDELSTRLFIDSTGQGSLDSTSDPTIIRTRFVEINFDLLVEENKPLVLNLFEDVQFTANLDHVKTAPSGALTWTGDIEGMALSQVILVIKDGMLVGNVSMPGAFYQVRYAGDGVHAVHEIDQSAFPQELPPIPVDIPDEVLAEAANAPMLDDGSIIDVLVVYTPAARSNAGGTTAMETLIDLAIAETNTSYANSGITQRVNLVHTAEVSYVESGFSTALNDITGTSDGKMDNVHALRDTHAADEVVLIIEDSSSCGIAWLMSTVSTAFEDHAFAVVHRTCATGYYSFGHELGHNMSAHHDWYVNSATAPYAYNHGYVNFPDRWRTVMAYNSECATRGDNCTRLQYWSNPDVTYNGDAMGIPDGTSSSCSEGVINPNCDADNRKTLNNTAYTVANFRASASPSAGPLVYTAHTIDDDNSGDSNGNNNGIIDCGETIELFVELYNQGSGAAEGVSAQVTTSDPYATFLFNSTSNYANISGSGTGANTDDFDLAIDSATPNGHIIHFNIEITASNGGPWNDSFDVPVSCPVTYDHWVYVPVVFKNHGSASPGFGLPINESFESGTVPPSGWMLVQTNPRQTWEIQGQGAPGAGSYSATCRYDDQLASQNEVLLSPEFQANSAQLQFQSSGSIYWCRDNFDNCDLNVWLVVGNWGGGDDIHIYTADDDWIVSFEWAGSTVNLTPHLPAGPVRVGFQYAGADGAQISLDAINITE